MSSYGLCPAGRDAGGYGLAWRAPVSRFGLATGNEKVGRSSLLRQMTAVVQNSPSVSAAERAIQKIVLPGQTPEGEHIFGVLVKRTYDVVPGGRCTRAAVDKKLVSGDVHYDD